MFIIEVVVSGGGVLKYIILKGGFNSLLTLVTCMRGTEY